MRRRIELTQDGSTTIHMVDWEESYHSRHGAIQESRHVFIQQGLRQHVAKAIDILEIGLGTGLNVLLTLLYADNEDIKVRYKGVEAFPLTEDEWKALNYLDRLQAADYQDIWERFHAGTPGQWFDLKLGFSVYKAIMDISEFSEANRYDIIYFDAFAPRVQPELWTIHIFNAMFTALREGGILVTYCSKGDVRRNMIQAGFEVEKIPGPPGKREMLRARK